MLLSTNKKSSIDTVNDTKMRLMNLLKVKNISSRQSGWRNNVLNKKFMYMWM